MNSPKPKRVVSKAEYARILAKNALLAPITIVCLMSSFIAVLMALAALSGVPGGAVWRPSIAPAVYLFGTSMLLLAGGVFAFRKIDKVEEFRPVTRKAIENLLAPDILVRASDLPRTPQEVLLRAAHETETPQEHLLRPAE